MTEKELYYTNEKIEELKDEELEKVAGGANMQFSKENNNIIIYMQEGSYSINKLFAAAESTIYQLGGGNGLEVCYYTIRPTLNEYKEIITKCVIDIDTFVPTYYVGDTPYTQSQVDNWK